MSSSVEAANKARATFHAKVLNEAKPSPGTSKVTCWAPPRQHLVHFFAEKVVPDQRLPNAVVFDSDESEPESSDDEADDLDLDIMARPHKDPNSYAWLLVRFACLVQQVQRLTHFLGVAGFDSNGKSANIAAFSLQKSSASRRRSTTC